MNPQRLAELQRQRDIVREHLAWLEREIAREHAVTPHAVTPAVVSVAVQSDRSTSPAAPLDLMPQPDPAAAAADARRGCLLLFIAAFAILGLALVAIYFLHYRDRPLF